MPRACTCCTSDRDGIDRALLAGTPLPEIATSFAVSEDALKRHRRAHVTRAMAASPAARQRFEGLHGDNLMAEAERLLTDARRLLDGAERDGDRRTALQGVRTATHVLTLLGQLAGELRQGSVTNILLAPAYVEVRAALLDAIGPCCRARVVAALTRAEPEAIEVAS